MRNTTATVSGIKRRTMVIIIPGSPNKSDVDDDELFLAKAGLTRNIRHIMSVAFNNGGMGPAFTIFFRAWRSMAISFPSRFSRSILTCVSLGFAGFGSFVRRSLTWRTVHKTTLNRPTTAIKRIDVSIGAYF
jgi:hypothetical protein